MARDVQGTLYLLHLERPFGHMQHYLGWTANLDARLAAHASGQGANVLRHVRNAGIGWTLARTWETKTRVDERRQHRGSHKPRCPICRSAQRDGSGKGAA